MSYHNAPPEYWTEAPHTERPEDSAAYWTSLVQALEAMDLVTCFECSKPMENDDYLLCQTCFDVQLEEMEREPEIDRGQITEAFEALMQWHMVADETRVPEVVR